jgi:hypothetical protein
MFIGCGFAETSGVYGLLIAFLLIFVNPLVNSNLDRLTPVANAITEFASNIIPFLG